MESLAMKKAFTLIELLVVIAIIAILAAILFPVFAQAKAAAKKTASISNQKQISLGVTMYGADNDDMYPRNDDCQPGSSLNPAQNTQPFNPTGLGCTAAPFFYRVNHFSWQKWIMPYVKNIQLFVHPNRTINGVSPSCAGGTYLACGQITGHYILNTSITGQLNTYNRPNGNASLRNSWLGGSMTALPNPSATMALMDDGNYQIGVIPIAYGADSTSFSLNVFPPAIRELWAFELGQQVTAFPGNQIGAADENRAGFGGVVVGHADGSAKFYQYQKFLSMTPTAAQYGVSASPAFGFTTAAGGNRGFNGGTIGMGANPNTMIQFPLWGLGQ
jgi:prepilin-type N-terminal cleavage/methylation domain-containing protein